VLFVGINPGIRSAQTGHHFAGYSNRFWKLLYESGLVPEPIGYEDDDRLGEWGYGITNLVPRPTPGIDSLRREDYVAGWRTLERKIRRHRPEIVALIGVTLYRAILPLLFSEDGLAPGTSRFHIGVQPATIAGARVFVLPNPSGRNANFSYAEMLQAYRRLRRAARALPSAVILGAPGPDRSGKSQSGRGRRVAAQVVRTGRGRGDAGRQPR
jgi:TDG/mug DNA glycosylase family protein